MLTDSSRAITTLRSAAKSALQKIPSPHDAIVVASFGRAGSTLIYDAVVNAMAKAKPALPYSLAQKLVQSDAFDPPMPVFRKGVVYKTHAYPDLLEGQANVRAIFLFGSAVETALSVHAQKTLRGEGWVKRHFDHLRRPYDYENLLKSDVLGLRDQCIAWMGAETHPVLCLRYEGLWENTDRISEFCGLNIRLPVKRRRTRKDIAPDLLAAAQRVYSPIDEDLARLPDCFIAESRIGRMLVPVSAAL